MTVNSIVSVIRYPQVIFIETPQLKIIKNPKKKHVSEKALKGTFVDRTYGIIFF